MNNQLAQLHYLDVLAEELDMELLSLDSSSDMLTALELKFDKLSNIAAGIESYGMCRGDLASIQELGFMKDKCADAFTHARTNVGSVEVGLEASKLSGGILTAALTALAALLAYIVGKFFKWAIAATGSTSSGGSSSKVTETFKDSTLAKALKAAGRDKDLKKFLEAKDAARLTIMSIKDLDRFPEAFDYMADEALEPSALKVNYALWNDANKDDATNSVFSPSLTAEWKAIAKEFQPLINPKIFSTDAKEMYTALYEPKHIHISPTPDVKFDLDKEFESANKELVALKSKFTTNESKLEKTKKSIDKEIGKVQGGVGDSAIYTAFLRTDVLMGVNFATKLISKIFLPHLSTLIKGRLQIESLLNGHRTALSKLITDLGLELGTDAPDAVKDWIKSYKKMIEDESNGYDELSKANDVPQSLYYYLDEKKDSLDSKFVKMGLDGLAAGFTLRAMLLMPDRK